MAVPPMAGAMPSASAAPPDPGAGVDSGSDDTGSNILATVTGNSDGTFTVYAGPSPADSGQDTSGEDAAAMGGAGDAAAPQGTTASSPAAATKAVYDILSGGSGDGGGAEGQFAAGFGGASASGPVAQKY